METIKHKKSVMLTWENFHDILMRSELYIKMKKYDHIEFSIVHSPYYYKDIPVELLILTKNVLTVKFHTIKPNIQILTSKNLTDIRFSNHNAICPFMLGKKLLVLCFSTYAEFNEPIELSKNLHMIQLGSMFNQPIRLPKYTRHVSWAPLGKFYQPIVLTKYLKYIRVPFSLKNNLIIEIPLEHIVFYHVFLFEKSHVIENLPDVKVFMTFEMDDSKFYSENLPRTVKMVLK